MSLFKKLVDNTPTEELFSTTGDYGLRTLSESADDIVDIVFVHGLTGNRESTWTDRSAQVFWPQDLLPKDLQKARIATFGYDADIVRWLRTAGNSTLRDHGKALAEDVAMWRKISKDNLRPLIFVAHSLGGLVVEQALLISNGSTEQHVKDLLDSTEGIAFMGTPHLGSIHANWGVFFSKLSNLLRQTNSKIVEVLNPNSEMLAAVQQDFHTMLESRRGKTGKRIEIFCFYEEVGYLEIAEIVPKQSAILAAYRNIAIPATHTGMTRFKTDKDVGYIRVRGQLLLWYNKLEEKKKGAAERQQQRLLPPSSDAGNGKGSSSHSGVVFNAPITSRNLMAGTNIAGGTNSFHFSQGSDRSDYMDL